MVTSISVVPNLQVANSQFVNENVKVQVCMFFVIKYLPWCSWHCLGWVYLKKTCEQCHGRESVAAYTHLLEPEHLQDSKIQELWEEWSKGSLTVLHRVHTVGRECEASVSSWQIFLASAEAWGQTTLFTQFSYPDGGCVKGSSICRGGE